MDITSDGITCSGLDETKTFQNIIERKSDSIILIPRKCRVVLDSIRLPLNIQIVGEGSSSVLQHKSGASGHMLFQSHKGSTTVLANLTLDGNYMGNGGDDHQEYVTFLLGAGGASTDNPTEVWIENVAFVNGGYADVSTHYSDTPFPAHWVMRHVRHLGGAIGFTPPYHDYWAGTFSGAITGEFTDIVIDPQRLPTTATQAGRAGYGFFLYAPNDQNRHALNLNSVVCTRTGHSTESITGGCVAVHEGVRNMLLDNLVSRQAIGVGVNFKANIENLTIQHVVIDGVTASDMPNAIVNGCIAMDPATADLPQAGHDIFISSVHCSGSQGNGIHLAFGNGAHPTALATHVTLSDFIIADCRRVGLSLRDPSDLTVRDGTISRCGTALNAYSSSDLPLSPINIIDTHVRDSGPCLLDTQVRRAFLAGRALPIDHELTSQPENQYGPPNLSINSEDNCLIFSENNK